MLFNSVTYGIFLPIVFGLYWRLPHKYRWLFLFIASYYFYMSWNIRYTLLLFFTTFVSYIASLVLENQKNENVRKIILIFTLVFCLGILFYFKYFLFFSNSIVSLIDKFTILNLSPIVLNIVLPVGISFYTFQTLGYVFDVYNERIKPEHHFGVYATYISFFPQLVAGPIERTENLLPQIKSEKKFDYDKVTYGLKLMAWGYFKKLVIADVVAPYVDLTYSSLRSHTGIDLIIAIFFFTVQIYCDFSGYSDIAIGTAKIMGIDLMDNFKSPYFSGTIREFWSRWHISLSTWFRDYVYIPLGGNRCNKARNSLNIMITFLASGLWHGASWTFVIWGGIHGAIQILENLCRTKKIKTEGGVTKIASIIIVFIFCNFTWVFFRSESLKDACYVLGHILDGIKHPNTYFINDIGLDRMAFLKIFICIMLLAIYDAFSLKHDIIQWITEQKGVIRWSIYTIFVVGVVCLFPAADETGFLYFQF